MNSYNYHHAILQHGYYAYGPLVVYDQVIPVHYTMGILYPSSVQFVDNAAAILNTPGVMWVNQELMHLYSLNDQHNILPYRRPEDTFLINTSDSLIHDPLEDFLEDSVIMRELEAGHALLQLTSGTSGSGLSKEEVSKHLQVYTTQGKMIANCEGDICSICLGEYEKKEKIGRLECGHRYHAECIKRWLLSKNVCPVCRSTALAV